MSAKPDSTPKNDRRVAETAGRVTMRQIAERLGISHVAVSLALRDRPGVSDALRTRIRKTAESLGYRPDPLLSALNNYRHGQGPRPIRAALGWITLWRDPADMHALRELDAYWLGAKEVAEKHGYHLYEFSPNAKNSLAATQRVMLARSIEGILLSPPEKALATTPPTGIDWQLFSVVRLGNALIDHPFHIISSAQNTNTTRALARMRELGYQRIGLVTSRSSARYAHFLDGYLRANEDVPSSRRLSHLCLPEADPAEDRALLRAWLKSQKPDAVFSNIGSIKALLASVGYTVPRDLALAVTSVQDCDADSGIDQSPLEIGRTACETLISLLTNGHRGIPEHQREILVEGRWVDGSSMPLRAQKNRPEKPRTKRTPSYP